ncbi:ATP-binding protein [Bacillus sp. 31A1R]|uniref:histidine kinase n=1 Tax=Robertmurraya mangrovi TaxID=3098077 RepID=A0ABU5IZE9_9BACI|nr:ATP-binding protein [Bacillus sp. 31A1R]MDZ5472480.1 ATP-binding protein [Bacillus sp. 31A1R]
MIKFRTRLLFALITLIFAVLIGLGLLLGQLFKSYYLNSFDARLKKESSLISTYIEDSGGVNTLQPKKMKLFSEMLDSRITIINNDGELIYDSGQPEETTGRHLSIIEELYREKIVDKNKVHEVAGGFNLHYYWDQISKNGEAEAYVFLSTKLNEIKKAYHQIWWILIVSLGLSLIIIILLGTRITNRYTKPIESATNVAIELAKGNYRARTYEDHIDETGMLSSSINILARNLQEMVKSQEIQQDRLETLIENMGSGLILIDSRGFINLINRSYKEVFNVGSKEYLNKLYYDVIKHKEISEMVEEIFMTEQKLRKQVVIPIGIERRYFEVYGVPIIGTNDVWKGILLVFHEITEIKKLEQMRKDFVANVSHELKTPVTSIKGFSETLLDGAMEDQGTLEAFLNIILKESDRLQSLIQDLLDLSKIEQQGFNLSLQEFDLVEALNEVIAILQGKASEKGINLKLHASVDKMILEGDLYRIKQIFINLINNAISYTPNDGEVSITLFEKQSKVYTQVKDTGIGIEKEEISRIFERFYRVDKARSRNSGGTGLGLAIVKHLVEAHKGNITVDSEVGKGTTFTIEMYKKYPKKA